MFCKNCGTKVEEEAKFCGDCGSQINNNTEVQSDKKEEKIVNEKGEILHVISEINNPSMTFSGANGHWLILFTAEAVFFVKTGWSSWYQGGGALVGGLGMLAIELVKKGLSKKEDKDNIPTLSSILTEAKKYYKSEK